MDATTALTRPRWRGRLHQVAFFVSIPAGLSLIPLASTAAARTGVAVYAATLTAMYAASAALHRIDWGPRALRWMRHLDHSMIFLMIAGTYTPFAPLALRPPWSTVVLAVVWGGAALGVTVRLLADRFGVLQGTLYLVLGWIGAIVLPWAIGNLGITGTSLMFAGGLCYTVGAVLFWLRRPVLRPEVFGYHELWHVLVVAGSLCHYGLILYLIVRS
ncbi:MAG: PAQR family membrane homeostasis protein TrhA [Actinomycetota bacterium]